MTIEPIVYTEFQTGIVFELNAYGRPKGTGLTAYMGKEIYGTQVYNLTLPEPRRIPHSGNARLLKTQILPSKEAASAELQIGAEDLDLLGIFSGVTPATVGGMNFLPFMTDLQGKEAIIGLLLYQPGLKESGGQIFHWHMIPNAQGVVRLPSMQENPQPVVISLAPNPITTHLWGMPLGITDIYGDVTTETGALTSGILSGYGDGEPAIAAFIANGSEDTFPFPSTKPANDVANVSVFTANGATVTEVDSGDITVATTGVTFDTPPTLNHEVIIVYQH